MQINIASFNTSGLNDTIKRKSVFQYLRLCKFDVVLLQETHSCKGSEQIWSNEQADPTLWNYGASSSGGVAALLKPSFKATFEDYEFDSVDSFFYQQLSK